MQKIAALFSLSLIFLGLSFLAGQMESRDKQDGDDSDLS